MTPRTGYKWRSTFGQINRNNWTTITNVRGALINEFCETVEDAMCAKKKNKKKTLVLFLVRIVFVLLLLVLCCANTQQEELKLIWIKINMDGWELWMCYACECCTHTTITTTLPTRIIFMCRAMLDLLPPRTVHSALPPLTRQPHLRKAKQKQIDVNRRR